MKNKYLILRPLFMMIWLLSSAKSFAQTQLEKLVAPEVTDILQTQMALERTKSEVFNRNTRLEYIREKTDSDMKIESYKFSPKNLKQGAWSKVDTAYSQNEHDEKVWESEILFDPNIFDKDDVKLNEGSETHWSFDMEAKIGISVNSEKSDVQNDDNDVFRARVNINKASMEIDYFTIYSVKKFSPRLSVSVDSYILYCELTRLREDGPLVVTLSKETVSGSAGFFFSIDEQTTIKNFKFVEHHFSH